MSGDCNNKFQTAENGFLWLNICLFVDFKSEISDFGAINRLMCTYV